MALTDIDRQLLNRCMAEEPGAWRDFVDRFMGLFVHVIRHTAHIRSIAISSADVDELCAEIFLVLLADKYAALRHFREKSSLATYLSVIARRVVVREMSRRRMAEALGHVQVHQEALEQASAVISVRELKRVDDLEEVQIMLDGLDPLDAKIVRQFHLEGRSYREISSNLSIPENSIGPALTRAREKLKSTALPAR